MTWEGQREWQGLLWKRQFGIQCSWSWHSSSKQSREAEGESSRDGRTAGAEAAGRRGDGRMREEFVVGFASSGNGGG